MKKVFLIFSFIGFSLAVFGQAASDTTVMQAAAALYQFKSAKNGVPISPVAPLAIYQRGDNKLNALIATRKSIASYNTDTTTQNSTLRTLLANNVASLSTRVTNVEDALPSKLNNSDTTGNYAKYYQAPTDVSSYATTSNVASGLALKLNKTDTVGNYTKYYQAPSDLSSYALKSEIGKDANTYFFVDKSWTGTRGGTSWTAQASVAKRASRTYMFADIWQARDSAIAALRRGEIASAVVYVLSGNSFSFAEDTSTVFSNVDYKIPTDSKRAVQFWGSTNSDTTSTITSNLAYRNLIYIFEKNTSLYNYTASKSIISRDNILYSTSAVYTGGECDNHQILGDLHYESWYGQNSTTNALNRQSEEINIGSTTKGFKFEVLDFISRRGYAATSILGISPQINIKNQWFSKTRNNYFSSNNTDFANVYFDVKDYRVGGAYTDASFNVADYWGGFFLGGTNKNFYMNFENIMQDCGEAVFCAGYGYGGVVAPINATWYLNIKNLKYNGTSTYNVGAPTGFLNCAAISRSFNVIANISNLETALPLMQLDGAVDSSNITFNCQNGFANTTYSAMSSSGVFNIGGTGSKSVIKITGTYRAKGFASIFNITSGSGTIILDGDFRTLDDKPIVNVTSGFTGKLIVNGKFIVGSQITSPSSASISGNGSVIVQSAISNKAATATVTGNAISVNTAFKF